MNNGMKFITVLSISLLAAACEEDAGITPAALGETTTISTVSEASGAAYVVTNGGVTAGDAGESLLFDALYDGMSVGYVSARLARMGEMTTGTNADVPLKKAAELVQRQLARFSDSSGGIMRAAQTETCTGGGTITVDVVDNTDANGLGKASLTVTASNCVESDFSGDTVTTNGSIAMNSNVSQTSLTLSLKLGNGDNTYDSTDWVETTTNSSGSKIFEAISSSTVDISAKDSSLSLTINGGDREDDVTANERELNEFEDLSFSASLSSTETSYTSSGTINGFSNYVRSNYTTGAAIESQEDGFSNLKIKSVLDLGTYGTTSDVNGGFSKISVPTDCGDGVYEITTVESLVANSYGTVTSGQIKINDNVTVTYNSDGSTTVAVDGQQTTSDLSSLCTL